MEVIPKLEEFDDVVIYLNFTYGDAEAFLRGRCSLPAPEGTLVPLESVSKDLALEWLLTNCPNTTEQFDEQLDRELAEKANEPFVYDWAE